MRRGLAGLLGIGLALLAFGTVQAKPFYSDWAAIVVAGDWHAHSGGPSEAFDNARRDVAGQLEKMGFEHQNVLQFSVRPERYPDTKPGKTEALAVYTGLKGAADRTSGGCLVYFSSHGNPQGILFDDRMMPPEVMGDMIDQACPGKPTIVIISACFSGVFVPILEKSDRMILTAARPDRSSFGCSESDKYPFFDDCFLRMAPGAHDFVALGRAVQTCVADKEVETGMAPPSEPQMWVGPALAPMLPLYGFPRS
jgi:hypothetical protein